jgi:HK97 family phage major capsid protein
MPHEKTAEQLVQEVNAKIENINTTSEKIVNELKIATEKSGKEATEAVAKANTLAQEVQSHAGRIIELEQKIAAKVIEGKAPAKTLGRIVTASEAYKQFAAGNSQKFRIEANTITGQEGSPAENSDTLVAPQRWPGIIPGAFRNLTVGDLLPIIPVSSNSFEYTKESTFTNASAETAEGAAKPESDLEFELVTANIRTVPTFLKVSKQVLDDAAALAAYIDQRLRYAVDVRFENQLVNGNGTGQNIAGMTKSGNHTAFTPVSGDTELDSLNKAQGLVADADYEIDAYLLRPSDWHAIERLKDNEDRYIIGNPLGVIGRTLWGKPVILSNAVAAGKFIAANFQIAYAQLLRSGTVVEMFEQDEDNVQKNLVTVRAERRGALATFRPASVQYGDLIL